MSVVEVEKIAPIHRKGITKYEKALVVLREEYDKHWDRTKGMEGTAKVFTPEEERQIRLARIQVFHSARQMYQRAKRDLYTHLDAYSDNPL